jgi:elongator complex protein 6
LSNGGKWVREWYASCGSFETPRTFRFNTSFLLYISLLHHQVLSNPAESITLRPKQGLDFPSLVSSKRLTYVNGLIDSITPTPSPLQSVNFLNFSLGSLQDLEDLVRRTIKQNDGSKEASKTILIMDGLDFLLASQPSITSLALSRTIMTLRQHFHNAIVTSSADSPLLHNSSPAATPLESEHRAFVTTMAHQSRTAIQLRSLGTGAAKDISGVLRVSAGGAHDDFEHEDSGFEEGEWLYQVKGDGSVKVWGRGE